MDNCPICNRHVLAHAKQISCSLCNDKYHMKCISLVPCELSRMQETSQWYCSNCLSGLFPFNHIEDDEMFIAEINSIESKCVDITAGNILTLCHLNIRSMRANLSSFEICLKNVEYNFSVIGLSETWLRDYRCNLYNIDGYTFIEVHRSEKAGGGVGIFVREYLSGKTCLIKFEMTCVKSMMYMNVFL